jgi:hypothetical protein
LPAHGREHLRVPRATSLNIRHHSAWAHIFHCPLKIHLHPDTRKPLDKTRPRFQSTTSRYRLDISSTSASTIHPSDTMFSCANYERGCRGRCNANGSRCSDCIALNLQARSSSTSSTSSTDSRPMAQYSAMTSSFASLKQLNSAATRAS